MTSPTDFDAAAARASLTRIVESGAERAFLTHFGEQRDLHGIAAQLDEQLEAYGAIAEEAFASSLEGEALETPGAGAADFDKLKAERDSLFERLARTTADFQNSRKRLQAEADQRAQYANANLIKSLLPVIDNFERALAQDPGEQALALIDRLASHHGDFTLFLDDFEAVQNAAVAGLVWQLVESLRPGCRVVIGTRWVPETGLARLRARGELLEIEPAQLRFSADETASFLRQART